MNKRRATTGETGLRGATGDVAALADVRVLFQMRLMVWSDERIDRLRDRLALAKRQGTWLSTDETGLVLGLIRLWRQATKLAGFDGVAQGALPTISECRTHGITGIFVECRRRGCGNRRPLPWGDLRLPDSTVFVDIGGSGISGAIAVRAAM